jgi:hypothetical protein
VARITPTSEDVSHFPHYERPIDLEYERYKMECCFAWNLVNIQGMNYTQAARVLGVWGPKAKNLTVRYEKDCAANQKDEDWDAAALERDVQRGLFVWEPLIFSEAMALHKSLNPC